EKRINNQILKLSSFEKGKLGKKEHNLNKNVKQSTKLKEQNIGHST
ncbi:14088_t:CDS:1, partial [Racocetra fulgida]